MKYSFALLKLFILLLFFLPLVGPATQDNVAGTRLYQSQKDVAEMANTLLRMRMMRAERAVVLRMSTKKPPCAAKTL